MGFRTGLNLFRTMLGRNSKTVVTQIAEEAPAVQRMTKTMTDSATGIVRMERPITYGGEEAAAILEKLPDGTRKLHITGGRGNPMWRTTNITEEASIFGGKKITVNKHTTKYWCYGENSNLTKEYNPQGILEHKELNFSHSSGNGLGDYHHNAIQDRVYDEVRLTSSAKDMLVNPSEHKYIKHALDEKNNYHQFTDGAETNYTRMVAQKEQESVKATKIAEEKALAEKLAAEKAAAELAAKQPRINISKALNRDINELKMTEKQLADGTIERVYTDPDTGKILVKTQDLGIGHKEWIYGGKADMIYMSQVGKHTPYIVAKKGNYTQLSYAKPNKLSLSRKEYINNQYYNDGNSYLQRYVDRDKVFSANGRVQVFDPTAAEIRAKHPSIAEFHPDYPKYPVHNDLADHGAYQQGGFSPLQQVVNNRVKELNADVQQNFVNLDDLFSAYKA